MHIILDELISTEVEQDVGGEEVQPERDQFEPEYDMDDMSLFLDELNGDSSDAFEEEEEHTEEEADESEEESDTEEESEESETDEDDDGLEDQEEEELEIGDDYLIALEDGTEATFKEMKEYYNTRSEIKKHVDVAKEAYEAAVAKQTEVEDALTLSKLEAEMELETYADMTSADWREMARTRPQDYAEHKEYYDRMTSKRNQVEKHLNTLQEMKEEKEQEAHQARIQESITILEQKIPGFDKELVDNIVSHAINDLGAPESIADTVDPYVILAFYNSFKLHKGVREAATKIKRKVKTAPLSSKTTKVAKKGLPANVRTKDGKVDMVDLYQYLQD